LPRNRMIKPEFWESKTLARISLSSNLLFIALWNFSDDYGSYYYNSRRILGDIFSNRPEITKKMVDGWILELLEVGLLKIYEKGTKMYIQTTNWDEHQRVDHPSKRRNPQFGSESEIIDEDLKSLLNVSRVNRTYNKKEKERKKEKVLGIPTLSEIKAYCLEIQFDLDAQHFLDYQEARDWVLSNGKKVKNWKAVIRTWKKNKTGFDKGKPIQREIPKIIYCDKISYDKQFDENWACTKEMGHRGGCQWKVA